MLMGVHPVVNAPCNAGCESDQDHDLGNVERHGIHPRVRIVRSFFADGKAANRAGTGVQGTGSAAWDDWRGAGNYRPPPCTAYITLCTRSSDPAKRLRGNWR